MKQNILIATLLAAMLALAGCGGGNSSNVVNTATQIEVAINACTTAQCVDDQLAKADAADKADLMEKADDKKKALADMEPKSVDVAGLTNDNLALGKSETITVEAGTPRDVGTKTYKCPEGTCEITFTNVLGTITAMATGGVTVEDKAVAPNLQLPPRDGVQRSNDKLELVYGKYSGATGNNMGWYFEIKDGNTNALKSSAITVVDQKGWQALNNSMNNDSTKSRSSLNAYIATTDTETVLDKPEIKPDAAYMVLGAWAVAQPGSANLRAGKHYHSSKALTAAGKSRLDARLGESDGGTATYDGQAVGVTVTGAVSGTPAKFTPSYTAWTNGAVRLMADFEKMELKGWVKKDASTATAEDHSIALKKASIASYAASGDIASDTGINAPDKTGSWRAEFSNDGSWIIGEFDDTPKSKQDDDYMQHYGTFGACNPACN